MNHILKTVMLLFCLLIFGIYTVFMDVDSSYAESLPENPVVSEEMLDILINNLDRFFPITSLKEYFTEAVPVEYSDDGPDTVIRIGTNLGKRNILIFANADFVHDHSGFSRIDDLFPDNFQLTMDVTVNDVWPESKGGCFIGFTNYGVSAFSGTEGAEMVTLLTDGNEAELYVKNKAVDSGIHYSMGSITRNPSKLSIIHLTEHTYVFLNGQYAGQYHDGKSGPFQLIFGAAVFADGDTAGCTFDNLVLRKLSN